MLVTLVGVCLFAISTVADTPDQCFAYEVCVKRVFEPSCALDAYQRRSNDVMCTCKAGTVRVTPHLSSTSFTCTTLDKCVCGPKEDFVDYGIDAKGCLCKVGLTRSYENDCVSQDLCKGAYEIYSLFGDNTQPRQMYPNKPGCRCEDFYTRNANGTCVRVV